MRDAIEHDALKQRVAQIVNIRRAEIIRAYQRELAAAGLAEGRSDSLVELAGAVLDEAWQRLAESLPAPAAAGDLPADPAAHGPAAPSPSGQDTSAVLLRATLRTVVAELAAPGDGPIGSTPTSHADASPALIDLAIAIHESITVRSASAASDYAGYLLDRLHRSHVDERRRVARELHDLVSHSIAVVMQELELYAVHRDRDGERAEEKLAAALASLRDTLDMLRAITQDLRWSAAESGLAAALRSYLESSTAPRPTELRVTGDEARIPPAVQGELFLVLREALRNAHVHSEARAVQVDVDIDTDAVHALVRDDGTGFDTAARPHPSTGTGLASMQERVALLGGVIEVRSAPGEGTTVSVDVPLVRAWDDTED